MVIIRNRFQDKDFTRVALIIALCALILILGFVYLADSQSEEVNLLPRLF